jgi:hypothetical protein
VTPPFTVTCDDPTLRAAVEAWLAESHLVPPQPLELHLEVVDGPWRGEDRRAVLRQPSLDVHYGPPDRFVRLVWRDGIGHAVVAADAPRADVSIERAVAPHTENWFRPFLMTVVAVLVRRIGWSHIHAATAVDPSGRGWLIAGDAHSGKSTTAALLASRGWGVGTDDTAFLVDAPGRVEALAWREPIALRDGGYELLALSGGLPLARRRKTGLTPEELGGRWVARVAPDVLAIAALHEGPTQVEPLRSSLAVADLLSWSLFFVVDPEGAQRHLEMVARLARQARCYRLRLGRDIFEHPDLLSELVP